MSEPDGTGTAANPPPQLRLYAHLLRASRAVLARVEPLLALHGLTVVQYGVLEAIMSKGPQSHRELGRRVLTSAGNMTDVVDKLEKRGLVSRLRDHLDRRQVHVALTAEGSRLVSSLYPLHLTDVIQALQGLTEDELLTLDGILRKIHSSDEEDETLAINPQVTVEVLAASQRADTDHPTPDGRS